MDIDKTISDIELLNNITDHNNRMQVIVNENPSIIGGRNSVLEGLFLENIEYYKLACARGLRVPSFSFMRAIASILNYTIDSNGNAIKDRILTKGRKVL